MSRFDLAPPRHFLLPALLLLIAEEPSHGYQLAEQLAELRFGRVDRPSVYRALAQLEGDKLVEVWSEAPVAGSMRRVYGLTEEGARVLRAWMGVVKEEREMLDRVLRRYAATGTIDALLAEAESNLVAVGGTAWSPVSPIAEADRISHIVEPMPPSTEPAPRDGLCRYVLDPDRSVVLIEARSTVGPISFGAVGLEGTIDVEILAGELLAGGRPSACVHIPIDNLRSGNGLYDAELRRRIGADQYPVVSLALDDCTPLGVGNRYRLAGTATLHGVTRPLEGTVVVTLHESALTVAGDQRFDIRDFGVESPTVLMLRIYPDVTVRLHIEAARSRVPLEVSS